MIVPDEDAQSESSDGSFVVQRCWGAAREEQLAAGRIGGGDHSRSSFHSSKHMLNAISAAWPGNARLARLCRTPNSDGNADEQHTRARIGRRKLRCADGNSAAGPNSEKSTYLFSKGEGNKALQQQQLRHLATMMPSRQRLLNKLAESM
jgi:hypothetical protein